MKLKVAFITYLCALVVFVGSAVAHTQEQQQQQQQQQEKTDQPAGNEKSDQSAANPSAGRRSPGDSPFGQSPFLGGRGGSFGGFAMQSPNRMMQFASAEMGFDNGVVLNAAFSGEIVYENIQTLSDGNRIINRSSTTLYRDGLGRTRREQVFNLPGQPPGGPNERRVIYINDVVGGVSYTIDPINHTAIKTNSGAIRSAAGGTVGASSTGAAGGGTGRQMRFSGGGLEVSATRRVAPSYPQAAKDANVQGSVQVKVSVNENGEVISAEAVSGPDALRDAALDAARQWQFKPTVVGSGTVKAVQGVLTFNFNLQGGDGGTVSTPPPPAPPMVDIGGVRVKLESKTESLGTQKIEGIAAEGTRYTDTIPAGAIGNERQIDIVRERWYSPELQMVILMSYSDPRYGETTQRLTNIDRSEPDSSLFSVDGYDIKERPNFMQQRMQRMNRRRQDEQ
ncbi:MAG: TonB family protein [Blastocatellia bacterium]|nr:TonB family protein [Blastocatellia bacterium]